MKRYTLGIDVGTASVKVAAVDESGILLALRSESYRVVTGEGGKAEIDGRDLRRAMMNCFSALFLADGIPAAEAAGIGISCLCPGLCAFDSQGSLLVDPIIYSDCRSAGEAEWIRENVGEERLFALTANTVMAGAISGTSMLWLKRNLPEVYEKTRWFGHVNTMVAAWLTGQFAMDHSNASYTALFETAGEKKWSRELCEAVGIDMEKLPPLLASHQIVGELIEKELIGMGIPAGTPVVIGGGDTACASLAAGVTGNGDVCESVGSTDVLTVCVDQPRFSRSFINRCHVVEGTWIWQGALSHTGSSLRWFRDQFCPDYKETERDGGEKAFAAMDRAAERSVPGAGGVVFLPYMMGERSPVWDSRARGVFFGMSLSTTRDDMIRAVLEACGYGLRQLSEIAEKAAGRRTEEFISLGGGAKSLIWAQLKADILGADIHILERGDMAPVGAALLAGVGAGLFSDPVSASGRVERKTYRTVRAGVENRGVYDQRYRIYTELYPRLKELF